MSLQTPLEHIEPLVDSIIVTCSNLRSCEIANAPKHIRQIPNKADACLSTALTLRDLLVNRAKKTNSPDAALSISDSQLYRTLYKLEVTLRGLESTIYKLIANNACVHKDERKGWVWRRGKGSQIDRIICDRVNILLKAFAWQSLVLNSIMTLSRLNLEEIPGGIALAGKVLQIAIGCGKARQRMLIDKGVVTDISDSCIHIPLPVKSKPDVTEPAEAKIPCDGDADPTVSEPICPNFSTPRESFEGSIVALRPAVIARPRIQPPLQTPTSSEMSRNDSNSSLDGASNMLGNILRSPLSSLRSRFKQQKKNGGRNNNQDSCMILPAITGSDTLLQSRLSYNNLSFDITQSFHSRPETRQLHLGKLCKSTPNLSVPWEPRSDEIQSIYPGPDTRQLCLSKLSKSTPNLPMPWEPRSDEIQSIYPGPDTRQLCLSKLSKSTPNLLLPWELRSDADKRLHRGPYAERNTVLPLQPTPKSGSPSAANVISCFGSAVAHVIEPQFEEILFASRVYACLGSRQKSLFPSGETWSGLQPSWVSVFRYRERGRLVLFVPRPKPSRTQSIASAETGMGTLARSSGLKRRLIKKCTRGLVRKTMNVRLLNPIHRHRKRKKARNFWYPQQARASDTPTLGLPTPLPIGEPNSQAVSATRTAEQLIKLESAQGVASTPSLTEVGLIKSKWLIPVVFQQCQGGKGIQDLLIISDHTNDQYTAASCGQFLRDTWGEEVSSAVFEAIEGLCRKIGIDGQNEVKFEVLRNGVSLRATGSLDLVSFEIFATGEQLQQDLISAIAFVIASVQPARGDIYHAVLELPPLTLSSTHKGVRMDSACQTTLEAPSLSHSLIISDYLKITPFAKEGQSYCWTKMFDGATIVKNLHGFNRSKPPGLMLEFPTLVSLAAVHSEVCYDGGIILVGFQTALIPLVPLAHQPVGSTRWHFVSSSDKRQITHDVADRFANERLKVTELELLRGMAFVGFCAEAVITLGSNLTAPNIERSDATPAGRNVRRPKKTLSIRQIQLDFSPVPRFNVGIVFGNDSRPTLPTTARFSAQENSTGIVNQAKDMYHIIYDDLTKKAWLVPALNLLLYCVRVYLHHFEYPIDRPCFFLDCGHASNSRDQQLTDSTGGNGKNAPPPRGPETAEEALSEDIEFIKPGGLGLIRLHILMAKLWARIVEGNRLCLDYRPVAEGRNTKSPSANQSIWGLELCDIAGEADFELKELSLQPAMKAWLRVANSKLPILFCNGIGEIIRPKKFKDPQLCVAQQGAVPGVLTCINSDLKKAFDIPPTRWAQMCTESGIIRSIFTCPDTYAWELTGNPFGPCDCSINPLYSAIHRQDRTCWSNKRLQSVQLCKDSGAITQEAALINQDQLVRELPPGGAVRFGWVSADKGKHTRRIWKYIRHIWVGTYPNENTKKYSVNAATELGIEERESTREVVTESELQQPKRGTVWVFRSRWGLRL